MACRARAMFDEPVFTMYSESGLKRRGALSITGMVVSTNSELVVPRSVRRRAGFKSGQKVEFKVSGGVISIVPKLPAANDEYTPAQRRVIDDRLRQARKGPYHGPFMTAGEAIAFVRKYL